MILKTQMWLLNNWNVYLSQDQILYGMVGVWLLVVYVTASLLTKRGPCEKD